MTVEEQIEMLVARIIELEKAVELLQNSVWGCD